MEERGKDFPAWREIPDRSRIVPLQQRKQRAAAENQTDRNQNRKPRIDRKPREPSCMANLAPDRKAEASDHDQGHQREVHDRVRYVPRDASAVGNIRQNVKACIAERGNRMEHAVPKGRSRAEFRQEPEKEDQRACAFDAEGAKDHIAHIAHHAAHGAHTETLRQNHPLPQADAPSERKKEDG